IAGREKNGSGCVGRDLEVEGEMAGIPLPRAGDLPVLGIVLAAGGAEFFIESRLDEKMSKSWLRRIGAKAEKAFDEPRADREVGAMAARVASVPLFPDAGGALSQHRAPAGRFGGVGHAIHQVAPI